MAKPSPKPQPIVQNPDGTFSLNTFLGGSQQFPATQNMSVMPPKPFTPITTASTGIPNVGIPQVKWLTTPIAPSSSSNLPAVWFSADRAKQINTAMQSVPDSLWILSVDLNDERVKQLKEHFKYLQDKGELMLNDKQSDYIKKWKAKNPEYKSIPDTTLYAKIITKFPAAQEKYGNINQVALNRMKRIESISTVPDRYKWIGWKIANVWKRAWEDFWNTVIWAVDTVWSLMKIGENEINMITWWENSFDEPMKYAPAQEAIDRWLVSNALWTAFAWTNTVLDIVPSTAAAKAWFDVVEDIPWLNLVPKAIWWAMGLASEWLQWVTWLKKEDSDNIVWILWNLAFAKWGKKWQAKINKAYREWWLKNAVYMTGLQVPQTVIDTALVPLNLWKGIYDTVRGFTKKQPTWQADNEWFSYRNEWRWEKPLLLGSWEPKTGLSPSKFEVLKKDVAESIIAKQWKIRPNIRRDIRQKTWLSAEKFALTNNLVWKDVEESLQRADTFKSAKINEKADIIYDWWEAPKTPSQEAMAISLRDHLKKNISENPLANDPELVTIINEANRFLESPTTTYTQIDALKSLYDYYNPDNLEWDITWRLKDPAKHQNAAYRRWEVQRMIEEEGDRRWVDIKQINKDIRGSHDLAKWLAAAEERMANNNIISLWDTQVAIMGSLLWWDIAWVWILAIKKMLGSESATSYIAKKLYNTPYDKTNPLSNSSSDRPLDRVGRFAGTGSTSTSVSSEVARATEIPIIKSEGWLLAHEAKTLDPKELLKRYNKLTPEEQVKARLASDKLSTLVEIDDSLKNTPRSRFGVEIPEERMAETLAPVIDGIKTGRYTTDELDFIEKNAPKGSEWILWKAFAEKEGLEYPVKWKEVVSEPKTEIKPVEPVKIETESIAIDTPENILAKNTATTPAPKWTKPKLLYKKDIEQWKYDTKSILEDYKENYMHSNKWKGKSEAIIIDSDSIKRMFNEYDPKNPWLVHEESSKLSKEFFDRVVKENPDSPVIFTAWWPASWKTEWVVNWYHWGKNIIFDTVLWDFPSFLRKAKSKIESGKVKVHAIYTDIDTAKIYNLKRERTVPEDILISNHKWFRKAMSDLINSKEYKDGKIIVEIRVNNKWDSYDISPEDIQDFIIKNKDNLDIFQK
jgi:hypothetical protein